MAMQITYYVHGTTSDNEQGLATGQADTPLSERGIRESNELKELTKNIKFDSVFASDLSRAMETARIAFGDRHQVVLDSRLREFDDGDFTRYPISKIGSHELDYIEERVPNGESYKDVEKRIADFLNEIRPKMEGKHIAIVAHRFPQLSLEVLLNGKSWPQAIESDWRKTKAWQPGWSFTAK
jgi:broad specificity phosphatase PhoE